MCKYLGDKSYYDHQNCLALTCRGWIFESYTLPPEYKQFLIEKLKEELLEFSHTPSEEEAADMIEVIFALFYAFKLEPARVEKIRQEKLAERGAFEKRIILEKIID
jgi:predicted house-cleaning noncanonical NTP pyrophosphatase (MazG superfamily)